MDNIRVASFNLFKYSSNTAKNLNTIASIIKDNAVDVLAIQEIFSKQALDNLLMNLGPNWEGRWDSPNSRSVSAAEGYAYVWDSNKITLSKRRDGSQFIPVIHNQYPHKDGMNLIRNPYYGRFVLKQNEMIELRLINTHIMYSMNRDINESDDHDTSIMYLSDVKLRKRELEILATKILPKLDDKTYDLQWNEVDGICRKPYTILLGDYNLNLKQSGAKDTFIDEQEIIIRDANSEKIIVTLQEELTTLKAKTKDKPQIDGYRNNFDHFTYDRMRPIETRCWAVDAPNDTRYYRGDYNKYKDDVSDHLMIVMEICFV